MAIQLIACIHSKAPQGLFDDVWQERTRAMFATPGVEGIMLAPRDITDLLEPMKLGLKADSIFAVDIEPKQEDILPGLSSVVSFLTACNAVNANDCCVIFDGIMPVWEESVHAIADEAVSAPLVSVTREEDFIAQLESGHTLTDYQYLVLRDEKAGVQICSKESVFLKNMGWTEEVAVSVPFTYPLNNVYNASLENKFVMDRFDDLILPLCVGEDILECIPDGHTCLGLLYALSSEQSRWVTPGYVEPDVLTIPCGFPLKQAVGFIRSQDRQLLVSTSRMLQAETLVVTPVFANGAAEEMTSSIACPELCSCSKKNFSPTGYILPDEATGVLVGLHRKTTQYADFLSMQEAPGMEWDLDFAQMKRFEANGGKEVTGRQVVPAFEIPDGLLVAGRLEYLKKIDELLEEGLLGSRTRDLSKNMEQALRVFRLKDDLLSKEQAHA